MTLLLRITVTFFVISVSVGLLTRTEPYVMFSESSRFSDVGEGFSDVGEFTGDNSGDGEDVGSKLPIVEIICDIISPSRNEGIRGFRGGEFSAVSGCGCIFLRTVQRSRIL